jgi:VWFA-related protein
MRSTLPALAVALLMSRTQVLSVDGQQGRSAPLFKGTVELVRLDVVVTDSHGKAIPGLTAADFEIVEDGKPGEIATFQHMVAPATPALQPAEDVVDSDVATNVPRSEDGRAFVIVIDDLHILESDLLHVKRVMTDVINGLTPSDEAAVVFTSRSDLGQNFTSDRQLLLKTAGNLRAALGFGLDALGRTSNAGPYGDSKYMLAMAQRVDGVLRNVATSLSGSSQPRRAIVYVSAGSVLPTTPNPGSGYPSDFEFLQDVYEAAKRADAPVYTIDPRGLVLAADAIRGGIGAIGSVEQTSDATKGQVGRINSNIRAQQRRLAEIAETTGGRYFTSRADLTEAVKELLADNGDYYLLGYYPAQAHQDGKFHPVTVKVHREGAQVRARPGFMARAASTGASSAAPITALNAALAAGVNAQALPLRAAAIPLAFSEKGATAAVVMEAWYPPRPDGADPLDDLVSVGTVALDQEGKIVASAQRNLTLKGAPPAGVPFRFLVDDMIDLPRKRMVVRVGFASRALGTVGTVQFDLDLSKDEPVTFRGAALGTDAPMPPVLNAAALSGLVPFQPTVDREFRAGDQVRLFGVLSWRSSAVPAVRVRVDGGGADGLWPVHATGRFGKSDTGSFDGVMPLDGISAGRHTIEIDATVDGHTAIRRLVLTVR